MDTDEKFYEQLVSLLLSMVCLIERDKLHRPHTTAELRKIAKEKLAGTVPQDESCQNTTPALSR